MRGRPYFLVADVDGITAVWDDDSVELLDPAAAEALVGDDPVDHTDATYPSSTANISLLAPTALAVTTTAVEAWSPTLGRRVALTGPEVLAMSRIGSGLPPTSPDAQHLWRLVALGVLDHGATQIDTRGRDGYLRVGTAPGSEAESVPRRADHVGVHLVCSSHIAGVPLGLGMLAAAVHEHDDGRLLGRFDLRPIRRETRTTLEEVTHDRAPAVFLFSNYMWSVSENLELSAAVKGLAPGSVSVHGGPSTPKYSGDIERFFAQNPHVDVVCLGEGERTVVDVLDRLSHSMDVDAVAGVPGTVVRTSNDEIVHGPNRERIADLGELRSPFLSGLFDHLDGGVLDLMPVETNRGCPYGCTFCDWGSATMSRIRTFPMERVKAELSWIAERDVGTLFITDANFGILPRDLDIARHLVELRQRHGAPRTVLVSFAKNQTLRAAEIVRTWIEGGIVTEGSIALQSSDENTLEIIRRRNIKVERYDELTEEFRALGLPLAVDLMMGLPGATVGSFTADLQRCIDAELTARIYPTIVLPNSPMNDPEYRREYELAIDEAGVVVGSSSYDSADYQRMLKIRRRYRAADHFGVLRHIARWVQHDHGIPATELLDRIGRLVEDDPGAWPSLLWVCQHLARWTVPPPGWPPLLDEVRSVLVDHFGLAEDSAMEAAFDVQAAHLPWPRRTFPVTVDVGHDYVAWFEQAERGGAMPLASFPPGTLTVEDPRGICSVRIGAHLRHHAHPDVDSVMLNEFWIADDWELTSAISRRLPQVLAYEVETA